ncbi:GNAT family N-acetyltransferase [Paracoccus aestuarii]|uniref:GNAT family N-acetyltransferase n=1 Tax=Paracoccus aestuarii TaxID=453842 RepID=A0A418ZQ62_9RHOB|nr:GNAT family N-acetyltransferase [Paracoccus aestuarii]RJK97285.1 GNAT family N-acetyltransferase [Paracoccus aestuarii]WCQ98877.1 GNAT family N-acetyltransferase [Paracoccus aestuarii]
MMIEETTDLAACHALRRTVFIEEQSVPEADEMDDLDADAIHLLARDGDRPVATARLLIKGDIGKIGRVCVLADQRGTGLGAALMQAAIDALIARGVREAHLGSQVHAMGFYEKLGFVAEGPVYDDAGIPHRDMVRVIA